MNLSKTLLEHSAYQQIAP